MAAATGRGAGAAARVGTGRTAPRQEPARRRDFGVVAPRSRRHRRPGRRTAMLALAVAVLGPLLVAGSYAELTAGQVRLTRLQQQLSVQQQRESALQLRVAQLEDPSTIVAEARHEGMVPAGSVTDIPEVPVGSSESAAIRLPAPVASSAGVSSAGATPSSGGATPSSGGATPSSGGAAVSSGGAAVSSGGAAVSSGGAAGRLAARHRGGGASSS